MLREATAASNDDARPYCETLDAHGNLGAELADAPPDVRAAAVIRSRRLPEPSVMRAAWLAMPAPVRDRFGTAALTRSFYSVIHQLGQRPLTLEAGLRCEALESAASAEVESLARAALPTLYGTDAEPPRWECADAVAAICPASEDASPLVSAIANHLKAEEELYAELDRGNDDPLRLALSDAEQEAERAALAAPVRDRADLVAFYEHFSHGVGNNDFLNATFNALALALQIGTAVEAELQTAAVGPGDRLSPRKAAIELHRLAFPDELAGLSPVGSAIVQHHASWQTLRARAAFLKTADDMEDRWPYSWPAEQTEDEALMDLLMVSCRDRADAEALVAHLEWYREVQPSQHPKRTELTAPVAAHIAIRLRDLSMILGRDVAGAAAAVLPGALAGLIAAHRAAWAAYLADPDALVKGSDRRFYLSDAVGEASGAILLAPCADHAEAAEFIEHAHWWRAELEAAGDTLADGFTCEAQEIRARAGDLSLLIANTSH